MDPLVTVDVKLGIHFWKMEIVKPTSLLTPVKANLMNSHITLLALLIVRLVHLPII